MRRFLIVFSALLAMTVSAGAQERSDRIGTGVGAFYPFSGEAVLFWEHEMSYHNAFEVFARGHLKLDGDVPALWENYKCWGVGAAWKPCLYRARNRYGSLRVGASVGAAPTDFLAGIHAGWQQSYALHSGWQFYWSAGVDLMLPRCDDLFRAGLGIGVKMPVPDRRRY